MMKKLKAILFVLLFLAASGFLLTGILMGWFMTDDTVIPPTCTEQGYTLRRGYFNKETILFYSAPLGHNYEAQITPPTCEQGGSTLFTCRDCGHSYTGDFTEPDGHHYAARVIAPNCTVGGFTENTCTECGQSYRDRETAPTGHSEVANIVFPTCSEQGYTNYTCKLCGEVREADFVEALGHDPVIDTDKAATCTEDGLTLTVCKRCSIVEAIHQEPLGHHFSDTYNAATCVEDSCTIRTCTREGCDYWQKIEGDQKALGHDNQIFNVHATCTEPGYTRTLCHRCGADTVTENVAPRGHDYVVTPITASRTQPLGGVYTVCSHGDMSPTWTDVYMFGDVFHGQQGDGNGILAEGVDLSHHNGNVDFEALKASGVSFVILRLGTSKTHDEKFADYYTAARAAGLHIGVYFYTYADSLEAARADAAWVIEQLGDKRFEYPIFYDIEDESLSGLDKGLLTDIALTFCDELVEAGYYPGVYTNKRWMTDHLEIERIREVYDIWLASWIVTGENISDYSDDFSMWQYTATGEVDGVDTIVDRNGVYRDFPAWIAKFGYNNLERVG